MSNLWSRDPLDRRALVLVFLGRDSGLWNSEINELVGAVEERVEAACVTFALPGGRHPSVVDALTAARFAGCTSAVVVVVGQTEGYSVAALPEARGEMPLTLAICDRDVESIVSAFEDARFAERAACA